MSLVEVAKRAGVSIATVSRVLNNTPGVRPETIKHVQKILSDPKFGEDMTEHNYELGKQFYSFSVSERQLQVLLHACFSREEWGW